MRWAHRFPHPHPPGPLIDQSCGLRKATGHILFYLDQLSEGIRYRVFHILATRYQAHRNSAAHRSLRPLLGMRTNFNQSPCACRTMQSFYSVQLGIIANMIAQMKKNTPMAYIILSRWMWPP